MTSHQAQSLRLIGLDPQLVATTAAAWEAQGADLTASSRALADVAEVASGFTDRVRPHAAAFAHAWAALTQTLAADCGRQAAGLRTAAEGLRVADDVSRAEFGRVADRLGAA